MAAVNMSLDEIISASKKLKKGKENTGGVRSVRGGARKPRGAGFVGTEHPRKRNFAFTDRVPEGKWQRDMFQQEESIAPRLRVSGGNPNKRVSINISNLDPELVSQADLEDLFVDYDIDSVVVHYDANGNSLGTAAIVAKKTVATEIMTAFKGVKLDGRNMKLVLVDESTATGGIKSRLQFSNGLSGRITKPIRQAGRGNMQKRRSGGKSSGGKHFLDRIIDSDDEEKPRGRGGKREKKVEKTTEDLDAELEKYMNKGKPMEA